MPGAGRRVSPQERSKRQKAGGLGSPHTSGRVPRARQEGSQPGGGGTGAFAGSCHSELLAGSVGVFAWFFPILNAAPLDGPRAFEHWMWVSSWR